ncbi:MAG: IS66 family transposase [bacterium]|nr:IS66 family transposase [bacterium]
MTTDGEQLGNSTMLPGDLTSCHAMIEQLLEALQGATRKIGTMEHRLEQLLQRLYGRSSEKLDPKQMVLFAEMLGQLQAKNPAAEPTAEPTPAPAASGARTGHGRRRLPADLPRRRVIHDLDEQDKPCPCCGELRTVIGEDCSEQIDFVPARVSVVEHVRLKYICKSCETQAAPSGPQIAIAEKPLAPIEKGLATPGLLAHVIVSKYADHLPLHRLERILGRHDITLARSTLCDWMRQSAEALRPLYDLMTRDVLASKVIHTDDTPVKVQDKVRGKTKTGRFWVYLGDPERPQIVFDYTPTRKRDGPMAFLADWGKDEKRFLQADAFGGYDGIYAGQAGGQVVEVACWAHARRKFYEARTSDPGHSARALAYIRLLYDVETRAKKQFGAQPRDGARCSLAAIRLSLRQEHAVPQLDQIKSWLDGLRVEAGGSVLPKSPMGQAITYALNQWAALTVYATDGDLHIDNNPAERALRRIAIGRKNWLFAGSDRGGRTAATLFSLIATCQRHGVEPFAYLRDVLTRISAHSHNRLADLLPNRWRPSA